MNEFPKLVWFCYDMKDGHGRPSRYIEKRIVISKCYNGIPGWYITNIGTYGFYYDNYEDIPSPLFESYYRHIEELP